MNISNYTTEEKYVIYLDIHRKVLSDSFDIPKFKARLAAQRDLNEINYRI